MGAVGGQHRSKVKIEKPLSQIGLRGLGFEVQWYGFIR